MAGRGRRGGRVRGSVVGTGQGAHRQPLHARAVGRPHDRFELEGGLFDLDRHWIPERGVVPGHWHYDARYVVRAGANEDFVVSAESLDLAWRDIDAIAEDPAAAPSLRRMARKWLRR